MVILKNKAIYKSFLTILKYKQEDFCNINDDIPFIKFVDSSVLSLILLKKAIRHDNLAVRRYCIKSFLKFKMHIKNFETFIYSSLFEILNTSVFYKDASYEQDSKFYPILTNYFVGIFSQLVEKEFNQNLKNFLISIEKYTTYCHPLIALFNVFEKLGEKKIGFLGISELLILDKIIKINYESLQYRKKIQLFNCIMHLIINFIDLSQLNFSFFRILIEILPPELFKFKSFLHTSSEFPIVEMIKNQNINNDFLNCNFLNREKMFVWLMTLPKNIEVLSNLYSIGNSCQKYFFKYMIKINYNYFFRNIDDFNFIVKYLSIYGKSNDFFSKNENEKIFHKPNNEILKTDFFNFLEPFFNELSLYQDSYKSTKNCILIFKKLNDLVSFPLEEGSLEYQKYILSQLNIYAGEVIYIIL